jgi:hypothetical protein
VPSYHEYINHLCGRINLVVTGVFMEIRQTRLLLWAISVLLCCPISALAADSSAPSIKSALLIGIDTYEHSSAEIKVPPGAPLSGRYEPLLKYPSLKGPSHDVAAMRA